MTATEITITELTCDEPGCANAFRADVNSTFLTRCRARDGGWAKVQGTLTLFDLCPAHSGAGGRVECEREP